MGIDLRERNRSNVVERPWAWGMLFGVVFMVLQTQTIWATEQAPTGSVSVTINSNNEGPVYCAVGANVSITVSCSCSGAEQHDLKLEGWKPGMSNIATYFPYLNNPQCSYCSGANPFTVTGTAKDGCEGTEPVTGTCYPTGQNHGSDVDDLVIYKVVINHCPSYFVPGHDNNVTYQIYPSDYTGTYGKFEIYKRDANGNPTGNAVYSSTTLNKAGGAERTFTYDGTEINYTDEKYVVKISIGQDANNCSSDTEPFDVVGWNLLALFWDEVTSSEKTAIDEADEQSFSGYDAGFDKYEADEATTDPHLYCAGVDLTTVTSSKVTVTVWYWDETEDDALSLNIDNATGTSTISASGWENDWGQDPDDKQWYDNRESGITDINGTFYSMSESNQYFYLKIVAASDGVIDNLDNPFDANTSDETRQSTFRYKLKIDGEGTLSILETTYYE